MVAHTTDDILRELDRTRGGPVQFEDPRTRTRYVLVPQESYYRALPFIHPEAGNEAEPIQWDESKNARRCALLERKYGGLSSPQEEAELATLQEEMYRYRAQVAPLPLKLLELVEEALAHRAASRNSAADA